MGFKKMHAHVLAIFLTIIQLSSALEVASWPQGFLDQHGLKSEGYQYGPTITFIDDEPRYVLMYCSPGANGAWDHIRMSTSSDFIDWSEPRVILTPQTPYESTSVCDPSIVRFHGVWFLYHTCINTKTPPDGYTNNRVCVAMADHVEGPYHSPSHNVVVQDKNCTPNPKLNYCLGQPSALLSPDGRQVYMYVTNGPIYLASSWNGINFKWENNQKPIYSKRDVDVKYDRTQKKFLLVQADVGFQYISYAVSSDGKNFTAYDPKAYHIHTNPNLPTGGNNNNPGLVGSPEGHFSGMTNVVYGSSISPPGWGRWKLFSSSALFTPMEANCSACVRNSCDWGCAVNSPTRKDIRGYCAFPGSTTSSKCCSCETVPAPETCRACLAPVKGGCVTVCASQPGEKTGYCGYPGSTNSSQCCVCLP